MYLKLKIPVLRYKHMVKCFPGLSYKALQLCNISLEVAHSSYSHRWCTGGCLETVHTGIKAVRSSSAFISFNFHTVCKAANSVQWDTLPFPGAQAGIKAAAHGGKEGMLTAQELLPPSHIM